MSAYALPSTFRALPSLPSLSTITKKSSSGSNYESKTAAATISVPAPSAAVTGLSLPPLKLPDAINNRVGAKDSPRTPARRRSSRKGSTTASPSGSPANKDPSIRVESAVLNSHLLTMSPRKIIRRGAGGGGLAYSPRRQARTVGGNGILDAIEVILTITSSGRTYTATRSLARIVELASDLIADAMDEEDVTAIPILPDEIKLMSLLVAPSFPPPRSLTTGGGSRDGRQGDGEGGLANLQDRLDSVRDVLNEWFRKLLSSVDAPNSIALAAFLWEPLWLTDGISGAGRLTRSSTSSNGSSSGGSSSSSSSIPLAESLSGDSSHSCNSSGGAISRPPSGLPPLAFSPNRSWRPAPQVRRGSADRSNSLFSIDETLLF